VIHCQKKKKKKKLWDALTSVFFLFGEILQLGDKKKALANRFERI
jgi:hypothetical protein